nr:ClpX C4-type zinc finger protein [Enterocloster clostridioformis]
MYCSFCGKSQNDVFRMIAEPSEIFICDRGSELCAEIISKETKQQTNLCWNQSGKLLSGPFPGLYKFPDNLVNLVIRNS